MDRIEVISNAMELRSFGKNKKRTWYRYRKFTAWDFGAMLLGLAVLLLSIFGPGMAEAYGLSRRETFGMLFENRGLFFLVASNFIFVQMIVKEAVPAGKRKPYWGLLLIPLLLLALV